MEKTIRLSALESWGLLAVAMVAILTMSGAILWANDYSVVGVHNLVRATAWTSFAFFILAFTAAAVTTLSPGRFSHWQRRNRRYFGLSFAFSHFVHALAIIAYVKLAPELFWVGRTQIGNIPGYVGYAFIAMMALTSFDTTARLVGPKLWKIIHGIGSWVVLVDFILAMAKRIPQSQIYLVAVVIGFTAILLRAVAAWKLHKKDKVAGGA